MLPPHISTALRHGRTDRRRGVSQIPHQPVAPLRQDDPLPDRDHPVRRRRGQLQSDLRPGHDDDVHPGRPTCAGAETPAIPTSPGSCRGRRRKPPIPVWTMNAIGDLMLHGPTAPTAVVVPAGRRPVRPVPRRGRDGTRSGGMVSAPVQPAGQPLHGARRRDSSAAPSATTWRCGGPRPAVKRSGRRRAIEVRLEVDHRGGRHGGTHPRLGGVDGGGHGGQVGIWRAARSSRHQHLVGAEVLGPEVDQPVDVGGPLQAPGGWPRPRRGWRPRR